MTKVKGDIQFRFMEEKDLDQICQLEEETFSLSWRREDFLQMIQQEQAVYLVAEDIQTKQIIGGCGVRNIVGEGEITNVVIRKDYRGQKIATAMLAALMKEGTKIGIIHFTLEVRESNQAAIALYQKSGFNIEGTRKNFYEKPVENGLIMWKRNDETV